MRNKGDCADCVTEVTTENFHSKRIADQHGKTFPSYE